MLPYDVFNYGQCNTEDEEHRMKLTSSMDLNLEASSPTIKSFICMSPTRAEDLITGRPTSDGNMCAGKFAPANPHFTNCKMISYFRRVVMYVGLL